MLAIVLALLLVPAANTWTVDDDGPADFTQISDAIEQALPGDVLLVEPGAYEPIELQKRVTILGRAGGVRPRVTGLSYVSAQSFTLAGLDFSALGVELVSDRGRIDDCRIGVSSDLGLQYALVVDSCAQLVVSRTIVRGSKVFSQMGASFLPGGGAMLVRTSNITLVDCELRGAKGYDAESGSGGEGGPALHVSDASHAIITACYIEGGAEGYGSLFNCHDGPSGVGLDLVGSSAILRGAPAYSSEVSPGWVDGFCTDTLGKAIKVNVGTVVISGVEFDPTNVEMSCGALFEVPPEPFVLIEGTDAPGGHRNVLVHGPEGAACMLVVSAQPAYAPLGGYDEKLWVGLSSRMLMVPLVTVGPATPVVLSWTVPESTAALVGLCVEVQPFFPGLPSALDPDLDVAGNVAELIVRF